jgi:hypothetical protein
MDNVIPTTEHRVAITYEIKACGRCGGSGHYSYCQMWGTTCFKCQGSGKVFSAAAKKAKALIAAKRTELCGVAVADLKPGQKFLKDGKVRTVVSVETEDGSKWRDSATGEWVNYTTVVTPKMAIGFCRPTDTVDVLPNKEQWDALCAYARTIKKGVTVGEKIEGKEA